MQVPLSWLREYVDIKLDVDELAHRLTMAGNEVDSITRTGSLTLDRVTVGEVLEVSSHPNADRLQIVRVNDGSGEQEAVCGAPNVAVGQRVAFAGIGAELIDAYSDQPSKTKKLRKARIRGIASTGMICSEKELGISENHDEILVLSEDATVGAPVRDLICDAVLDIELTPNRPDCLGIVGVARDVAALTGESLIEPPLDYETDDTDVASLAKVSVVDHDLAPRYMGAVIRGVSIAPSPDWLQQRLIAIGERPINNVVDATNFVMFELGQPLHAFDYDKVQDHHVIVRRAFDGETLTTLDGVERKLSSESLLIADPSRGIGLAGIMGGENTEISDETVNVFLEAANFNAENNRRTASMLGLRSEATLRFEKGLLTGLTEIAIRRCLRIISQVAGGSITAGLIDAKDDRIAEQEEVDLSRERICQVMGIEYSSKDVESTLDALGFDTKPIADGWRVKIPYWRPDISIPEDLIEELARIIGYDDLPATALSGEIPALKSSASIELRRKVVDALVSQGFHQVVSYAAVAKGLDEKIGVDAPTPAPITIENPISRDHSMLRRTLRPTLLETAARNTRTWRAPIALFESGKIFIPNRDEMGLPSEIEMVTGVFTGPRSNIHWDGDQVHFDFFDAKGAVEHVLDKIALDADFSPFSDPLYAPGAAAQIFAAKRFAIGSLGVVKPEIWSKFDPETAGAVLFEIDLNMLEKLLDGRERGDSYKPFSRYPDAHRDLALVMERSIPVESAINICRQNRLIKSVAVFDLYAGSGVPAGQKSVALRLVYHSRSRTLTSDMVARAESQIIVQLQNELGATLRQ